MEAQLSDTARWHLSRDAAARGAARVLAASGVLLLAEIMQRAPAGGLSGAADLILLGMGVVSLVALSEAAARLIWLLCRRLSPTRPMAWLVLFSLPLVFVIWPTDPWSHGPGAGALLITALLVAATTWAFAALLQRVESARVRVQARRLASMTVALSLICSLGSASASMPRVASLWLVGVAVFLAILFARLMVTPAARFGQGLAAVGVCLVLGSVLGVWRHWEEPRWSRLSMGEGGVLSGFREMTQVAQRPLRAFANEDAGFQDASQPVSISRDEAQGWSTLAGLAVITPDASAAPLAGGRAAAISLRTPDALVAWREPLEGPARGARASLWLRPARAGAAAPLLRLSLWGPGGPVQRTVRLGDDWTELSLETSLDARLDEQLPGVGIALRHELDVSQMRKEEGGVWWVPLPRSFERAVDAPADELHFYVDGRKHGARTTDHSQLRKRDAFDLWMGGLLFSLPDRSDPRSGAHQMVLSHEPSGVGNEDRASLVLGLVDEGVPVELLVWGTRVEPWPKSGDGARDSRDALRLQASVGREVSAVRRATRHVVVLVTSELPADLTGQPALRQLARNGQGVARAYASSDRGPASLASLATGLPPPVVLAVQSLGAPVPTWLGALREAGFHTFVQGMGAATPSQAWALGGAAEVGESDPRAPALEDELLDELRTHGEGRLAAFVRWNASSDGRASFDDRLARFVAGLAVTDLADEVLLVVTSLQGAAKETSARDAGRREGALRVPLVFRLPGEQLPRELFTPVSLTALGATLLDVAAPSAPAFAHRPSLLESLLQGDAVGELPDPALAWTEGARVLWLGDAKFVRDDRLGGELLYDLASDPGEYRPLYDSARLALLARRLGEEELRLEALTRALVSSHESELRDDLLAGLLVRDLDAETLRPLLDGFWGLNGATRRFLLETIYARGVLGLAEPLDALERDSFKRDDQLLLVLRVWTGSRRAARELAKRLDELEAPARRWMLEMLADLPEGFVADVAKPLERHLDELAATRPTPDEDEGRELAVGATGLAHVLGSRAGRDVKQHLVALQASWSRLESASFATLREPEFGEDSLLLALQATLVAGDETLLLELRPSERAARRLPEMFASLDGAAARSRLLELIDVWGARDAVSRRLLAHLVPGLRRHFDVSFSRDAIRRVEHWRTTTR